MSRGRAAWNVVTSFDPYAWNNFGHGHGPAEEPPSRADRYRRAAEFVEVVRALWDSWDDDAVLGDKASGAFGRALADQLSVDPDELDLDSPLPRWLLEGAESITGSQGARNIVVKLARRENLTVREILDRVMDWHRLVIGTPEQLADTIEEWFRSGAVDGFNLMPDVFPSGLELFVDHVVPLLRARGIFRHEYSHTTLRGHLGLQRVPDSWARLFSQAG
ncbi:LLM class oxidoreductase [Mycolicibacterium confluentis]|uniref:Monooxygenase n=1 Tax=Mycolicibacterium confluentis TaxID=28047 RepID=A0A7I7XWY9_9MYCO|nr:LLM class flavin-dependent oxidoreductase [Mycolicibacterium confluentis]MCV7322041.1 LLM class flavin-dependent oxidoreductase [Mycolicibacterium confluentis]ORV32273.1 hypothetical protein AWB99_11605 [Mycolicibacterium confluentis]BBZ33865.1 hypothetical protein MCNF_24700 [Mycolicibacterium confluentis]